jgi:pyruvate dehydrogenase E2 component (dihydrolipoamide acetyltransferase)
MLQGVRMPALGQTTDQLRIISWLKKEGDPVEQGEPLFAVETDKATLEVEAFSSGILRKIVHQEDEVVEVGTLVAYIGKADDELPGEMPAQAAPSVVEEPGIPTMLSTSTHTPTNAPPGSDKVLASPPVRLLMREHGIDPRQVKGSGPGGRIERRDVEALIEQHSSSIGAQSSLTPVPHHRQVIAQRLTQSVQTIPQIALTSTIDMRQAQALIELERERGIARLTYTHLILRAVARALRSHPQLNTLWVANGPQFQQLAQANVGLVVGAIPCGRPPRLLVVTIPEPDRLSLAELVSVTDAAIARGRQGALIAADTAQAAMAVSNLGMYGVDSFTAIVDPAQTAILAVGRVMEQPVVEEGSVRIIPQMKITLVIDHRVADGVAAALFLRTFSEVLEKPEEG